jgi:hypothetical protein
LFHAFKHHRAVVGRIAELNEMEYDLRSDVEPVSARAYDKAMHLLAWRPDLTNGMSVSAASEGGLLLDLIRNGREYVIRIEPKGAVSIHAGTDGANKSPVSIMSRSIDREFLLELDLEIPDPLRIMEGANDRHYHPPVPGLISAGDFARDKVFSVTTDFGDLIGFKNQSTPHGFDLTCFRVLEGQSIALSEIKGLLKNKDVLERGVMVARRFNKSNVVSLHDISIFPPSLLKKAKLPSGDRLIDLQEKITMRHSLVH